ncbi:MAG: aspartate kinase [Planctomycetes bacterium]|nr:aspartate kinase [Planctomycetota bacterium]
MNPSRIVQKFGGTSVGSAEAIARVGNIVKRSAAERPVVVVSAVGGVTNQLISLGELALARGAWEPVFEALVERHRVIMRELKVTVPELELLLAELHDLVRGIALIRERTPRTADYLASFGERLSARIVAAHLNAIGVQATALDAWDAGLVTDSCFGTARPTAACADSIARALAGVTATPVVTGYIGRDVHGNITTLGRGGSDYSAAIFGAALHVREIQIFTDVDGVLTADPRKVTGARLVETLSFAEAAELAFFGAKVLHPATMVPAVDRDIPIRVLNTFRPEAEGTCVTATLAPTQRRVKSIASKDSIVVVNVVAGEMMLQYGFLERIADAFARHQVVVDVIATSEVSVALTTDSTATLAPVVEEMSRFAEVSVVRDVALVSVVGEELQTSTDFAARVFGTLAELDVRLEMISYGATRNNLSFVVQRARLAEVVNALHERLFSA